MQEEIKKKRIRRTPEESKKAILECAEKRFLAEGPEGIRLKTIAADLGMSHGTVLYHFKKAEHLRAALFERLSLKVREEALAGLNHPPEGGNLIEGFAAALGSISDASRAPLLARLLAEGIDPFPPAEEKGLAQLAHLLGTFRGIDPTLANRCVLLAVMTMFGECLVGEAVRKRVDLPSTDEEREAFRVWMLELIGREIERSRTP